MDFQDFPYFVLIVGVPDAIICSVILLVRCIRRNIGKKDVKRVFCIGAIVFFSILFFLSLVDVFNEYSSGLSQFVVFASCVAVYLWAHSYFKSQRERADFRSEVVGFASCVAASDAGGGIFLGDYMDLVDVNISRVKKPQGSDDPLYGKTAAEFALFMLDFYARREDLPKLREYCTNAQRDVERLQSYRYSRSFLL